MSSFDNESTDISQAVVANPHSLELPEGFDLVASEARRSVQLLDLLRDARSSKPGALALYAVIDFGSDVVEPRLAVIDGISEGLPLIGLCFLNPDGSYTPNSGGRPLPINERDPRNHRNPAEVILRIGDFTVTESTQP